MRWPAALERHTGELFPPRRVVSAPRGRAQCWDFSATSTWLWPHSRERVTPPGCRPDAWRRPRSARPPWRSPPSCFAATRALAASASGTNTVDPRETAKFAADAALWWDETRGPFAPLHAMNPTRCAFVCATSSRHFRGSEKHADVGADPARPLAGLRSLDVGCGGGIRASRRAHGRRRHGRRTPPPRTSRSRRRTSPWTARAGKSPYRVAGAETLPGGARVVRRRAGAGGDRARARPGERSCGAWRA